MAVMDCGSLFILNPLAFYLSVVTILTIVSILTNAFIIVVNIQDCVKGKSLNPVDQILVALSLSNTVLSFCLGNYIFFLFLWPQFFLLDSTFTIAFFLMFFLGFSSSWLTAWLCLYFFVKIIHFKSFYLVKLKLTIDALVPWFIVFSEVVAFANSVPMIWSFIGPLHHNSTSSNQTCPIVALQINNMYYTFALGFSGNSAFFIVLVSTICIVCSLCRHTYRMKKTMSSEDHSRLRIHKKAAQTVTSLLLIYIAFYVSYILITIFPSSNNVSIYYWINLWVLLSTSPAISLVLIHGNSKLHLAFHKIFCFSRG